MRTNEIGCLVVGLMIAVAIVDWVFSVRIERLNMRVRQIEIALRVYDNWRQDGPRGHHMKPGED